MNEKTIGKRGLKTIFRAAVAQLMCVVLFTTIGSTYIESKVIIAIISVIMLLIFFTVHYSTLWYYGMMDHSRVITGETVKTPLQGLQVSAIGMLPFLVVNYLCAILYNAGKDFFFGLFNLLNTQFFFILQNYDYEADPATLYFTACWLPLAMIAVGVIGYLLGTKNISVLMKLVYSKKTIEE